jgi:16S rRNA (cytosine967-C5)-methyltransferase
MNAREFALDVVRDVFPVKGTPRGAHEAFDYRARRSNLDARDRAFAAELTYGTIKARRYVDWVLEPYVGERDDTLPPTIREILRLGVYQLRRMNVAAHAAVSETVGLAKAHGHLGTAGLVNAVLRRVAEEQKREPEREEFSSEDDYLATLYSFPTWIVATMRRAFGGDLLESILTGLNAQAQPALRVNLTRATPPEAIAALAERGVSVRESQLVGEMLLIEEGTATTLLDDERLRWEPQGEIAAVPVDVLDPRAEERIVELCSGRGNKTLQMVGRTNDRGTLEAIERDPRKIAQAQKRLEALDVTSVRSVQADATALAGAADAQRVLVDAPCSGLGILGRQPEARWRKDQSDAQALLPLQAALLEAAARRVAAGGTLVYSVCTVDSREGVERVDALLAQHGDFARANFAPRYARWQTPAGDLLIPPGIDRQDGFFIAHLERTA